MSLYPALISHDIAALGTVAASRPLTVNAAKQLVWTTTSNVTVNPISFTSTMTGAGTTGGRAYFEMTSNVALGGWCNAVKAYMNFGTAGRVTGLASALNAELKIQSGAATVGSYAPLESNLVLEGTAGGGNTKVSFLYGNVSGATLANFNRYGYLFHLGVGVTDTALGMFRAAAVSGINSTHALRIVIGDTAYFIPLHTSVGFA